VALVRARPSTLIIREVVEVVAKTEAAAFADGPFAGEKVQWGGVENGVPKVNVTTGEFSFDELQVPVSWVTVPLVSVAVASRVGVPGVVQAPFPAAAEGIPVFVPLPAQGALVVVSSPPVEA
jgi:hypothetical protein